jgi:putative glycosyltransferase
MKLSVVTTMYYSAPYLAEFYQRSLAALLPITSDYEFVFVNDGSPDNSLDVVLELHQRDSRIRVVDLSRNFGHHRAMMIGLHYAQGDLVFLIDCDLEEPPESLALLYQTLQSQAADVAFGIQTERNEPFFSRLTAQLYYPLLNSISELPITSHLLTARVMTQRYVQELIRHREQVFSIEGLWQNTGFTQIPVVINKGPHNGQSTYTLSRKIAMSINAITGFSSKPLVFIAYVGVLILVPSSCAVLYMVLRYFLLGGGVEGWASLIISIWFLSGLIILLLGIIAIYLAVIFQEVKVRPYAIVRQLYETHPSKEQPHRDEFN